MAAAAAPPHGLLGRDPAAELREAWAYGEHVARELELLPALRTRLLQGAAASVAGSLLVAVGAGGASPAERTVGAAVFAGTVGVAVLLQAKKVGRAAGEAFGGGDRAHPPGRAQHAARQRMAAAARTAHLCAWLGPAWLVLLPSALVALLSAAGSTGVASVVAAVAAAQVWLAAIGYCWLSCPAHCRAIRREHAEVPPAAAVWLAIASGGYEVAALASLARLPAAGSLGEFALLGEPQLGGASLLLLPLAVLAVIAAWRVTALDDALASALLGAVWLPLVRKLAGTLQRCGAETHVCGGQMHMVRVTGGLFGLVLFLGAAVHFHAGATRSQSLVLADPLLLTPAVACRTLLALVCGTVGVGAAAESGGRDMSTSAIALLAVTLAVAQLQWRFRRGLHTNLLLLNRAKDAGSIASLMNGAMVLLGNSTSIVVAMNISLVALTGIQLFNEWSHKHSLNTAGWHGLPQSDDAASPAEQGEQDTDVSYHAWLRKKKRAASAVDGRVCFSFWREETTSAHDIDRSSDALPEEAGGIGVELDSLTIREMLRSDGLQVTLLGLDASSVTAARLVDELRKSNDASEKSTGRDALNLLRCVFETVEFSCSAGELEPWLDDDIVGVQLAIHRAVQLQRRQQQQQQSGSGGTGRSCAWAYVDCRDKSSEPLQLLEIRRSRLTPDAAECMGWAIQANPTLRSVFLQFTAISGSLAKGLSVAQHLQSFVVSNAEIGTDGGSAIGTLCGLHGCNKLQLERSKLSEGGCVAMAQTLRGSRSLVEVRIMGCLLGSADSAGAAGVIESIGTCSGLQTLFLMDANLRDAGALGLAKGLTENQEGMPMLETLLLQNNNIGDDGAAALANVVQQRCPSLKMLRLDNNEIGMAGVEALCHGLARARVGGTLSIERVFLEGNNLGTEARAEWLGCCEALGVATDVALMAPAPRAQPEGDPGSSVTHPTES